MAVVAKTINLRRKNNSGDYDVLYPQVRTSDVINPSYPSRNLMIGDKINPTLLPDSIF